MDSGEMRGEWIVDEWIVESEWIVDSGEDSG